jgi:predicted PurR-regulated permease PerM
VLAYDYPILGLFWTFLWVFVLIAFLMILFRVIIDIFRSHDMGGLAKALWVIFVIVVPWLGVLVYLIARGGSMRDRDIAEAQAQQDAFKTYVQQTAAGGQSAAEELSKLADLKSRGVITDAEFQQQKAKLLA